MFQSPIHRIVVSSLGLNRFRGFFSALFLLCLVLQSGFAHAESPTDSPSPERQRALVHLVRQDCGSCHGMTLQGGLGPALTPEALRDKPVDSLVAVVWRSPRDAHATLEAFHDRARSRMDCRAVDGRVSQLVFPTSIFLIRNECHGDSDAHCCSR